MTDRIYFSIFWRNRRERFYYYLIRRPVNSFAKRLISRAHELGKINSHTFHELAGLIDRSLYPEYYKDGPWMEPKRNETPSRPDKNLSVHKLWGGV